MEYAGPMVDVPHALLAQLDALAARVVDKTGLPMVTRRLGKAAVFNARSVQYFARVVPERPLIALVLEGRKEVVFDGTRTLLGRGDVLVAPAHVAY